VHERNEMYTKFLFDNYGVREILGDLCIDGGIMCFREVGTKMCTRLKSFSVSPMCATCPTLSSLILIPLIMLVFLCGDWGIRIVPP
jgi:hypothetical protein